MGIDLKNGTSTTTMQLLSREDKFFLRWQLYNDNYYYQVKNRLKEIYSKVEDIKLDKQIEH